MKKQIASAAAALAVIGSTAIFAAPSASAAGCYDSAKTRTVTAYPGKTVAVGNFKTSSRCLDINVKTSQSAWIQVCFGKILDTKYCQPNWKGTKNSYRTVATNVLTGTDFYLKFSSPKKLTLHVAA